MALSSCDVTCETILYMSVESGGIHNKSFKCDCSAKITANDSHKPPSPELSDPGEDSR